MRAIAALALLLLALPAARAERPAFDVLCDTPEALDARIEYCSDNELAKQSALACRERLVKAIEAGAPELAGAFREAEKGAPSGQRFQFQFSHADHARAQAELERLIAQTTYNMHLLARYPTVMPDGIGIGLEPVPCYLDNAAEVEKAVHDLDDKIDQLKKARAAVASLGGAARQRGQQAGSVGQQKARGEGRGEGRPVPAGASHVPTSDITGVEEHKPAP